MPRRRLGDGQEAASPQFLAFIDQIVAVAHTVAPEVVELLAPDGKTPATQWSGSRERGLKLCALMLNYARAELADDVDAERLDAAIAVLDDLIDEASHESDVEAKVQCRSGMGDPAD